MLTHAAAVTIDRPADRVFSFMADLENAPKWQSGVTESNVISSGPIGVGTQFNETIKVMGRSLNALCVVIEFDPGKKISFRSDSPAIQFEGHYAFEPVAGGTKLSFDGWTRLGGLLRLLEPLFGGEVRKELDAELKRVKMLMETSV